MTVSAPAPAALHVPVVSLPASSDAKNSNASQSSPFKNVFDSLTFFDDLPHENGAQEEGAAVPNSSTKKEPLPDQSSGTHAAVVSHAPIAPQTSPPSLPKPSPIRLQSAHDAVSEDNEAAEEASVSQSASLSAQPDEASRLTAKSQASPRMPALSPSSLTNSSLRYSSLQNASQSPARSNAPAGASATPQAADQPSVETQSSVEPKAVRQMAPLAGPATDTEHSNPKPATLKSALPEPISRPPAQPVSAPDAARPDIQASTVAAAPSANLAAEQLVSTHVSAAQSAQSAKKSRASVQAPSSNGTPSTSSSTTGSANGSQPAQTAHRPWPAQAQTQKAALEQMPMPVPMAAPAPVSQPDAKSDTATNVVPQKPRAEQSTGRPTNSASSAVPSGSAAPAQSNPGPTLAAAATAASPITPTAMPAAREVTDRGSETPGGAAAVPHEAPAGVAAPKVPLVPQAENFAFAVRMMGLASSTNHSSPAQSSPPVTTKETPAPQPKGAVTPPQSSNAPQPAKNQTSSDSRHELETSATDTARPDAGAQNPSNSSQSQQGPAMPAHWVDAAVVPASGTGSVADPSQPGEAPRANLPLAAQEAHLLTPEPPRTSASSEILLHLTGTDQSSAAIRIADRSGAVNVSVHASDPILRESLRSNLGDLSNQLNNQGWKADVSKSATIATQSGSQQDSPDSGQRGSHQQQSFGGDRQPQRDRRANGGQWQQELEQQNLGGNALPGGNE